MATTRREFLHTSAALSGAAAVGGIPYIRPARRDVPGAQVPLRILILGGTGFIGPHQVNYALARGHHLTLFNRGVTNPGLFPQVEHLTGDRDNDIEALRGRDWDVVIDNHPSIPRWVRMTAELLRDHARQYVFVSTLSVYSDNSIIGQDESGPLMELEDLEGAVRAGSPEGLPRPLHDRAPWAHRGSG
jgi:2'-hydroxyisoflavone reductase